MKIEKVSLQVSNFEQTVKFYQDILQFKMITFNTNYAAFQIGESILELNKDHEDNAYYYHFAFNIHANLFPEAKKWLSTRLTLLKEDNLDEIDFDGKSQANACYFEDPAGNIVEFIARRTTSPISDDKEFSSDHILSISEISLTTANVRETAGKLDKIGIPIRDGEELEKMSLNFFGEFEDGAFILLGPIGRRWLFSTKHAIQAPIIIQTNKGIIDNF
ncbi:VOC family protein [Rummeliibacillus sp. NPDC094406]|uniref:VOC family protein n=1 Tax=Rummeliibacillus sp. NPDC094406 TaxID=3364511 RepID=UPI00381BB2F9